MSTYQLKKSQADLTDFFAAVFSQQYKDVFGRQNSQEKAEAFLLSIEEEGQILAALSYQLLYQTIKISDLAVLPSHQKQGLGTWLLKALKAEAGDVAASAQLGTKYVLYSYEGGKVLLIFNTDDTKNLYYITPNPEYLYFK